MWAVSRRCRFRRTGALVWGTWGIQMRMDMALVCDSSCEGERTRLVVWEQAWLRCVSSELIRTWKEGKNLGNSLRWLWFGLGWQWWRGWCVIMVSTNSMYVICMSSTVGPGGAMRGGNLATRGKVFIVCQQGWKTKVGEKTRHARWGRNRVRG